MRDPDSLAQVMGEILGEPAQLEQMRLASRAWVEANFEKNYVWEAQLAFL